MSLRPFRLPADLSLMAALIPPSFQYPENSEWGVQEDEVEGILKMVETAIRLWPLFALLRKVSPAARDVLYGFVWEEDGQPVRLVNISRDGTSDDWIIANVAVLPAYRRRGIARQLVEAAVSLARKHRARHILLDVIAGNTPAYELYASLGFTHFTSTIHLRHAAPASLAECQLPSGYTAHKVGSFSWRPRYDLAHRITPPEVQSYRPVAIQQFHMPASIRLFLSLISAFSGIKESGLLVRASADEQIVATVQLSAHLRGSGMNTCAMQLDPAHGDLAPYLMRYALRTFHQRSPKNRIELSIPMWEPALIQAARAHDFTQTHEFHSMGLTV